MSRAKKSATRTFMAGVLLFLSCGLSGCQSGEGEAPPVLTPAPPEPSPREIVLDMSEMRPISTGRLQYEDPQTYIRPRPKRLPHVLEFEDGLLTLDSAHLHEPDQLYDSKEMSESKNSICSYDLHTGQMQCMGKVAGYLQLPKGLATEKSYFDFSVGEGLTITRYDRDGGPCREVYSMAHGVNACGAHLSGGQDIFLLRSELDGVTLERIIRLDEHDNVDVLYEAEHAGYCAVAVEDESIFLLKQVAKGGYLETCVDVMDLTGKLLRSISLPGLEGYRDSQFSADRIYVKDKFIFLKWYRADDARPYMLIYSFEGEDARQIKFDGKVPCYLLHDTPVEDRFLIFDCFPDHMDYSDPLYERQFILFDMQEEKLHTITLQIDEEYDVAKQDADSDGTLFLHLEPHDSQRGIAPQYLTLDWETLHATLALE